MLGCKGNLTDDQKAKLRGIHMATKSRPMKTLRDFQKRKYGTPPTIIGQHATRRPLNATPIQDSIFTPSTTPQEDAVAVAAVHDQDDVSSYVNSNAFEVGEVVAFRGTDGLPFNLLRVTHNVSLRSLGPRSRVRGDFLVETARDDVNICYSLDLNWINASMRYAHVLRDGNDGVVTLFLEEAVTVTETKFLMTTETYGEILEIAEQFEDSIKRALQSDESHEDVCEERSTAGTETCTEVELLNLQKVIMRHKRPWYIKIVGKEEAEGTDIKTSLLVYDEFDGRSLTFACLKKVSDPTLILAVTLLT